MESLVSFFKKQQWLFNVEGDAFFGVGWSKVLHFCFPAMIYSIFRAFVRERTALIVAVSGILVKEVLDWSVLKPYGDIGPQPWIDSAVDVFLGLLGLYLLRAALERKGALRAPKPWARAGTMPAMAAKPSRAQASGKGAGQRFPKGAVIIEEGALELRAYKILSGSVEISKTAGGRRLFVRTMGRGAVFGEIGLLLERPRTATVTALEDTEVRAYDSATFSRLLREDIDEALPVLKSLFELVRRAGLGPMDEGGGRAPLSAPDPAASQGPPPAGALTLTGLSARAKATLKREGASLAIRKLPFKIGRSAGLAADVLSDNDLSLEDYKPFNVSRNHCCIDVNEATGGYLVLDRGSALGTIVNGQKIGASTLRSGAPLDRKVNQVILGTENGGWAFELTIG